MTQTQRSTRAARLTDEQIAAEEKLLEGVPRFNVAAFLMPPIWGPAHGIWATIVFYPLWILADTAFVNALQHRTPLAIVVGVLVFVLMTALTAAFAVVSQPFALRRALSLGVSKETYLRRQCIWAAVSVIVGAVALIVATYYNLFLNPALAGLVP